ncbi:hypothetical protein ACQJBY_036592 [Aegilops geniculata]
MRSDAARRTHCRARLRALRCCWRTRCRARLRKLRVLQGRGSLLLARTSCSKGSPDLFFRKGRKSPWNNPAALELASPLAHHLSVGLVLLRLDPSAPPLDPRRSSRIRRPDHQPRVASCLSCGWEEDDGEERPFIHRLGANAAFGPPPLCRPRSVRPAAQTTNQAPPFACPVVVGRIIKTAGSFM